MASSLLKRHLPSTTNSVAVSSTRPTSIGWQSCPPQQPQPVCGLRMPAYQSCASAGLNRAMKAMARKRRGIFAEGVPGLATSLLACTGNLHRMNDTARPPSEDDEVYSRRRDSHVPSMQQLTRK